MSRKKIQGKKSKLLILSWVGTLLLIAGISLALFPFLTNAYNRLFPPPPVEEEVKEILTAEREEVPFILPEDDLEENNTEFPDNIIPQEATVLYIPELDVMTNVTYGVELEDLRKIPGIYPQSGYPDTGNVSIAAHRDAWFRDLDKLEEGDEIRLYYDKKVYVYAVESVFITHSRDWSVIDPADEPALTLTTCHPPGLGAAPYRLIARAYLQEIIENLG